MVEQNEHNKLYIDKLEGHVNFIYDPNDEYADTEGSVSYTANHNI